MKDGIKTSEFWVTAVSSFLTLFGSAIGLPIEPATAMSIAGMAVSYIAARTAHKIASSKGQ